MSEYPPTPAGTGKKSGLAGCLVASLVGCGLLVVLAVSVVALIGWRLTRQGPPTPPLAMRDGTETFFLHATLRAEDSGVTALVDTLLVELRQAEATHGPVVRSPMLDSRRSAEGWRAWFPLELDVVRAGGDGGASDSALVSAHFPAKAGMVRAMFRLMAFFIPTEAGAPIQRTEIDGTPVLVATPIQGGPELRFAVALFGDRLIGARELGDLQAALRRPVTNVESDEPSSLAGTIRLESEDGWGYTRPRDPSSADDIHLAVFSFDLESQDIVRWRAALRGKRPAADRATSERALIATFTSASLPEGLSLTLDETRRWMDDRTLVIEGRVDGVAKFLEGLAESAPEGEPDEPPAPSVPSDDSKPQT